MSRLYSTAVIAAIWARRNGAVSSAGSVSTFGAPGGMPWFGGGLVAEVNLGVLEPREPSVASARPSLASSRRTTRASQASTGTEIGLSYVGDEHGEQRLGVDDEQTRAAIKPEHVQVPLVIAGTCMRTS